MINLGRHQEQQTWPRDLALEKELSNDEETAAREVVVTESRLAKDQYFKDILLHYPLMKTGC